MLRSPWAVGREKRLLLLALACAAVDGPVVLPRAESVVVASSFEQALICFRTALAFLEEKYPNVRARFRVQDSVNRASITDKGSGAMIRLIGSDPKRAHGLAPALIIADEVAQWPAGNLPAMLSALETSRGKLERTTMLWLGTRASVTTHPFEKMLSGADYVQSHFATSEDNPFHLRTWRKANPGLDAMPDAPGEEGEGGQGGRQHSRPKHHRQAGQGRTQNRRSAPGTGARRPSGTPPFDTDRSERPLHDDGPS